MATDYKLFKVSALPPAASLVPNALYFVSGIAPTDMELHVSDSTGANTRRLPTTADIVSAITTSIGSLDSAIFVADIAARDALAPTKVVTSLVQDATADPLVNSGAATYMFNPAVPEWVKISEAESLDVSVNYADLVGAPTASTSDLDDAVAKKHVHANSSVINKWSENGDGLAVYDGDRVLGVSYLSETPEW